jgi:hypothetical protein
MIMRPVGRPPELSEEEYAAWKLKAGVYYLRGRSIRWISFKMKRSYAYTHKAVHEFIDEYELPPEAKAVRVAVARYDELYVELWKRIPNATDREAASLIGQARTIEKDRIALLGFARPTRFSLVDEAKEMYNEELAELIAMEKARQLQEEGARDAARCARRNGNE